MHRDWQFRNWLRWNFADADWQDLNPKHWRWPALAAGGVTAVLLSLTIVTWAGLADKAALDLQRAHAKGPILLDRHGNELAEAADEWNVQNRVPLYRVPERFQQAVLLSEDRRFYHHGGVDWMARLHGFWQGIKAGRNVRGASTITEQVVRMLVPRPRTLWSKWLEGFDANRLEHRVSKTDILEFYMNQIPYAANRRGVVEAAHYYFDRDLDTLDAREMIALAVLPRAPSGLDPFRNNSKALNKRSISLATAMRHAGVISSAEWQAIVETPLEVKKAPRVATIGHFRKYAERQLQNRDGASQTRRIATTLDGGLMTFAQGLLDERLATLKGRRVNNGAVLVVDHRSGEILAWVVAGADADTAIPGRFVDAVLVPRQPGSALKPFLYAAAFDAGWSPGQLIEDAPLSEAVGTGLHRFNNYSRQFYGEVTARQALGNSLNIPAIHTVEYVGAENYLDLLHRFGFSSLTKPAGFYGDGLALGNGEVSLLELVRGFTALANDGALIPLRAIAAPRGTPIMRSQVVSKESAMLIGNILSDPWARVMEFGRYSTLNLPVQTAVKTGTSTDYRDAWSVGYDSRYVVGIWMGNLDQSPSDGVTGSTGPSLVLRGLFAYLNRDHNTGKLPLASDISLKDDCAFGRSQCGQIYDFELAKPASFRTDAAPEQPSILSPSPNLRLAYDPRLPAGKQVYRFQLGGVTPQEKVTWLMNGAEIASGEGGDLMWRIQRGSYAVEAVLGSGDSERRLGPVAFTVR